MEKAQKKSFWALIVTQFFGAFNDNVLKTLVTLLVVAWVAIAPTAPGRGPAAPGCDLHGRAALVCRQETVAPFTDLNCASFGRGGRVCSDRR